MNTMIGDRVVDAFLKKVKDVRTKETINHIKNACHALIKNKKVISIASVSDYCINTYGKPSRQTLYNDKKEIYKEIINKYSEASNAQAKINEKFSKLADKLDLPLEAIAQIKYLENRVKILETILEKQFSIKDENELVDLNATIRSGASIDDGANLKKVNVFSENQIKSIKILIHTLIEAEIAEIQVLPNGKRMIDKQTKRTILSVNDCSSLEDVFN
jgi:hypothetical protein